MWTGHVRNLRIRLHLSRSDLARFLGVSEPTIVRWESERAGSEPKGLQAVLLQALADALTERPDGEVTRIVRSCGINHREAMRNLFAAAER